MLTVIETPEFISSSEKIWSNDERDEFIDWIADHPMAGDVIPGTAGLRKVRWTRSGIGKQGGARVIYFNKLSRCELVLLLVYTKSKFDNLRPEFLIKLKEHFNDQAK